MLMYSIYFADNEMLRRQFAEKANQVGPWIERQMDAVTAIGMGLQGSLEDQLHQLKQYEQNVFAYKPHIEELEKIHQAVQEGMIFENRYIESVQAYRNVNTFLHLIILLPQVHPLHNGDIACWLGTIVDIHQPQRQRGRKSNIDERLQGYHPGTIERI